MLITKPADVDPTSPEPIELAQPLLDQLAATRTAALATLAAGAPVYGVNTGMGALSKVRLTAAEQAVHQRNLLLARAVGGPPWLDPTETRAVLLARLRTLLAGDPAVSVELIHHLVAFINSGQLPQIPASGAGSAGEIIPLAHAMTPLVTGAEEGPSPRIEPAERTAPAALGGGAGGDEEADRPEASFALGPKEGIALLAGIPGATGRAALHASRARRLADHLTCVAAGAIAVVRANRGPYSELAGRGDEVLAGELGRLRELAGVEGEPRGLQAAVSFRVAGQVGAYVRRAIGDLDDAVERAFAGVMDSPAYLGGEFVGTAGFHGIELTAYCDHLVSALAHAAEVSAARLHRLLDPAVTGLNAQLAFVPGPQAGLVAVHKRAVATTHRLRRCALPTGIGTVETSNGQEDVQSFSWEAVGNLGEAIRLAREVTACELLAVYQAHLLAKRPLPPGLLQATADVVPPIEADRPFGQDLTRLLETVLAP
ncbi:aromatic amino acid lyase [Kribbella sandramycini]|uniref:Aromatic amino acid lyase n=1 Tax=Kribbella sandramycini TaxID=60450 RepID=A0A7Y4L2A0_9ACTN|nr:aromatic amino acid lyase [Kribbella sandramycini]MBB6566356.1 histidine ammonia-lyase [Kribbella sandramycini]NOL42983.1 aromatic amino acid lyase [Kribbella sandramycini]